jgi:phosphoglycolate phosphatase
MAMKLLLFDIDGTLMSARGIPRTAMYDALVERFGTFKYDNTFNFSGRTDWEIVEHLLAHAGVDAEINKELVHAILKDFVRLLAEKLKNGFQPIIYPGIRDLLEKLAQRQDVKLGLVTGNVKDGARLKLAFAGLDHYFVVGGFGDDSNNRNDLPPLAIRRAQDHYQTVFSKQDIWVIGDSVHDIICAKVNQLRSLAVATGWTPYQDLNAQTPEFLLRDFSDVQKTLSILLEN